MSRLRPKAPSPALVISIVALFAALGGTSYAALANGSVGTQQLKNLAVTNQKLAKNSVGLQKVRDGAIATTKIANNAVGTGQLANNAVGTGQLANNAVGNGQLANFAVTTGKIAFRAVGLGQLNVTISTVQENVPNNGRVNLTAPCPTGTTAIAGSGGFPGVQTSSIVNEGPAGGGWVVEAFNSSGSTATMVARAVCITP